MNAERIRIECDERGFVLIIEHDGIPAYKLEETTLYLRLEDPEALYNACRAEIGPWLYERDQARLEYLRGELRAERISYGELAELQGLAGSIDAGDVELLEAAGVPEFEETIADVGHKHPDWYSVHVDHYDNRDKTAGV